MIGVVNVSAATPGNAGVSAASPEATETVSMFSGGGSVRTALFPDLGAAAGNVDAAISGTGFAEPAAFGCTATGDAVFGI